MTSSPPVVPPAVRWIAKTLEGEGFETWAVGGAIRDHLLGTPSEDWDLATRARPDDVQRLFRRTVPIGVDHGTVGVLCRDGVLHEVTTFRRDVETFGRRATVAFSETLDEDLARRDFTINALAYHPLRNAWYDPFGGGADLDRRILRTVGDPAERFREDYLRILRGLRFAGALGLTIEGATWRALVSGVTRTSDLSPERLREEIEKVLSGKARASGPLALYAAAGILDHLYPEIASQGRADRPGGGPGHPSWLPHALLVTDRVPGRRHSLRWAALLHGVGEWNGDLGAGESEAGAGERAFRRSAALLERLRSSRARIREVTGLVRWAAYPPLPEASDAELRRWCAGATREMIPDLVRLWIASTRVDERRGGVWTRERVLTLFRRLRGVLRSGAPLSIDELALGGNDLIRLGYTPGRHFGRVLERLLDRCLDDPSLNRKPRLESVVHDVMREEGVT